MRNWLNHVNKPNQEKKKKAFLCCTKLCLLEPNAEEEAPTPKFRCNDEVRKILYDIIQTEEQSIHIANQVA